MECAVEEFLESNEEEEENEINNRMPLNMFESIRWPSAFDLIVCCVFGERVLGHFYGFSFDLMKNRARRESVTRQTYHAYSKLR